MALKVDVQLTIKTHDMCYQSTRVLMTFKIKLELLFFGMKIATQSQMILGAVKMDHIQSPLSHGGIHGQVALDAQLGSLSQSGLIQNNMLQIKMQDGDRRKIQGRA